MIKKIALVLTLATFAHTQTSNNILTWRNTGLSIGSIGMLASVYAGLSLALNKYPTFSGFKDLNLSGDHLIGGAFFTFVGAIASGALFGGLYYKKP